MKDIIAKIKGPVSSTSRRAVSAYKHNTVKARRQAGRLACAVEDEDDAEAMPAAQMGEMRMLFVTQFRENYGAHAWDGKGECPQYWKNKGGMEYALPITVAQIIELGHKGMESLALQAANQLNRFDDYAEEFVIGWELLAPGEKTEMETWGIPVKQISL